MEQKIRGLLAYLFSWVGGLVVLLAFKDNSKQTDFNACQSIVLGVAYFAINIVVSILTGILTGIAIGANLGFLFFITGVLGFVSTIAVIGYIILAIIGMIRAYQETDYEIPVISNLTRKIFKNKLA